MRILYFNSGRSPVETRGAGVVEGERLVVVGVLVVVVVVGAAVVVVGARVLLVVEVVVINKFVAVMDLSFSLFFFLFFYFSYWLFDEIAFHRSLGRTDESSYWQLEALQRLKGQIQRPKLR